MIEPRFPFADLPSARDDSFEALFGLSDDADSWLDFARRASAPRRGLGTLGRYDLFRELGQGGQGAVFRARQPGTERDVAIKLLGRGFGATRFRDRFAREVRAVTRLSHPNIVTVHDAEIIDDQPALIMELIDGRPIDEWAALTAPGLHRLLRAFLQACDGVAHAHQRGVIHRDLKPSNVLVDANGAVKVVDFGIASLVEPDADSSDLIPTRTLGFVGTPAYAPPEVLDSSGIRPDTRSDVYSLGVLLYHLLAGRPPFGKPGRLSERLEAIRRGPVRPSSSRRDIPGALDWIVLKALEADPERRYQSVEALGADIRRFLAGDAVEAHPKSFAYRTTVLVRRHKALFAAVALAFASIIAVSAVTWRASVRTAAALRQAEAALKQEETARAAAEAARASETEARKTAESETRRQTDLTALMREIFSAADLNTADGRHSETVLNALLRAAKKMDERPNAWQPTSAAFMRQSLGEIFLGLEQTELAEKQFLDAADLRAQAYGKNSPERLASLHFLARSRRMLGRIDDAIATQQEVIDIRRAAEGPDSPFLAQALVSQAIALRPRDETAAEPLLREAVSIYLKDFGDKDDTAAAALNSLALCLMMQGCLDEADRLIAQAIALNLKFRKGEPNYELANQLFSRSRIRFREDRFDDALADVMSAHDMYLQIAGPNHHMVAVSAAFIADILAGTGRTGDARPFAEEVLRTFRAMPNAKAEDIESAKRRIESLDPK